MADEPKRYRLIADKDLDVSKRPVPSPEIMARLRDLLNVPQQVLAKAS